MSRLLWVMVIAVASGNEESNVLLPKRPAAARPDDHSELGVGAKLSTNLLDPAMVLPSGGQQIVDSQSNAVGADNASFLSAAPVHAGNSSGQTDSASSTGELAASGMATGPDRTGGGTSPELAGEAKRNSSAAPAELQHADAVSDAATEPVAVVPASVVAGEGVSVSEQQADANTPPAEVLQAAQAKARVAAAEATQPIQAPMGVQSAANSSSLLPASAEARRHGPSTSNASLAEPAPIIPVLPSNSSTPTARPPARDERAALQPTACRRLGRFPGRCRRLARWQHRQRRSARPRCWRYQWPHCPAS